MSSNRKRRWARDKWFRWRQRSEAKRLHRAHRRQSHLHYVEPLEPRVLLTTLFGGEKFEYIQADPVDPLNNGVQVRITITGNAMVELISADLDLSVQDGFPIFGDTPGRVLDDIEDLTDNVLGRGDNLTGMDFLGGVGGADGVEAVGPVPIAGFASVPGVGAPTAENDIQALASRDAAGQGATYAINVPTLLISNDPRVVVELAELDNATGAGTLRATLEGAKLNPVDVVAGFTTSGLARDLNDVTAMAFDPTTGRGYAVSVSGTQSSLHRFNRLTGVVETLGVIRNASTGNSTDLDIQALGINANGDLYFISNEYDGDLTADASDPDGAGALLGIPSGRTVAFTDDGMGGQMLDVADIYSNIDIGMVEIGNAEALTAGAFMDFTNLDVHPILQRLPVLDPNGAVISFDNFKLTEPYTGMAFDPGADGMLGTMDDPNDVFASEQTSAQQQGGMAGGAGSTGGGGAFQPQASQLHRMPIPTPFPAPLPAFPQVGSPLIVDNRGSIAVGKTGQNPGEDTLITGVAFSSNALSQTILTGVDIKPTDNNGNPQARLVSITTTTGSAAALNRPGEVGLVGALASYEEPGITPGRPFLYSSLGTSLFHGTSVTMPVDITTGQTVVNHVYAADFRPRIGTPQAPDPLDGRLFFVAEHLEFQSDGTSFPVEKLFNIDIDQPATPTNLATPDRIAIQNSLIQAPMPLANNNLHDIRGLAFDQTSEPDPTLGTAGSVDLVAYGANPGQLVTINENTGVAAGFANPPARTVILTGYGTVTEITGIDFIDDPTVQEDFLYATQNLGASSRFLRIRYNGDAPTGPNGEFMSHYMGPLPDPDDRVGPRRGENIVSLTYNETAVNPFTLERGAFMAVDTTTDELLLIDTRLRAPATNVFAIYVAQADSNTNITIGTVPFGPDIGLPSILSLNPLDLRLNGMQIFQGSAGDFRVIHAQTGNLIIVTADAGSGGVLIGTRTLPLDPVQAGTFAQEIGIRAQNVDDLPLSFADLSAGVVIDQSILDYVGFGDLGTMGLGANLDKLGEISVSREDGTIVVVDTDGIGPGGGVLSVLPGGVPAKAEPTGVNNAAFGRLFDDFPNDAFTLLGGSWPGTPVTLQYSYSNLLDGGIVGVTASEIRAAIEEGLTLWSTYAPLNFVEVLDNGPSPSDSNYTGAFPELRFGHHFIDGPSGVLAHAYGPSGQGLPGDVHFDDGEVWTTSELLEVFVHEVGHSLGLDHSTDVSPRVGAVGPDGPPIMNPFFQALYSGLGTAFLFQDDIDGIQAIYGAGMGSVTPLSGFVGTSGTGNEVAIVNEFFGALTTARVVDEGSTLPLLGVQGLDYGDLDFLESTPEDLFAIFNVDEQLPSVDIGGTLGMDYDIQGLTVTPGGEMFAVHESGGQSRLLFIQRDIATGQIVGVGDLGQFTDIGGNPVTNVHALEADPQFIGAELYIVGTRDGVNQELFVVEPISRDTNFDAVADEVIARSVGLLDDDPITMGVQMVTDTVNALAFDPSGAALFAVFGANELGTIVPATAVVGARGEFIFVDTDGDGMGDSAANVTGMDFHRNNVLFAVDTANDAIIRLTPGVVVDSVIVQQDPNVDNLGGYGEFLGEFFSVDVSASPDVVLRSANQVPTLGVLDPVSGLFARRGAVAAEGGLVRAMAFSPQPGNVVDMTTGRNVQGLYIIDGTSPQFDVLYEIDPFTGARVGGGGAVLEVTTNLPVQIESMDFDRNGFLFGHDRINGRLASIVFTNTGGTISNVRVGGRTLTSVGSLRPTVGGIAYDFTNDRFLGVDNATSKDLQNSSPAGQTIITEGAGSDSAILVVLRGTRNADDTGQTANRIIIGGTVMGSVNLSGSLELFYAGWVITGLTSGELEANIAFFGPSIPDNFRVGGDLRNLVVFDSIGTDFDPMTNAAGGLVAASPQYLSGFDLEVAGRTGMILTLDSAMGSYHFEDRVTIPGIDPLPPFQYEVERGVLGLAQLYNDSFDMAQFVGTLRAGPLGDDGLVRIVGSISASYIDDPGDDDVDYYAVSLLAGQTITAQLIPLEPFLGSIRLGVFDPDGRLVASDYSNLDPAEVSNQPFQFTATKAGSYRFAVGAAVDPALVSGDSNFDGIYDPLTEPLWFALGAYLLNIDGAGQISLGGLVANQNILLQTPTPAISSTRGDLGSINAGRDGGGRVYSDSISLSDIDAETGSVREVDAPEVGFLNGTVFGLGPGISAAVDAGLLRSRSSVLDLPFVDVGRDAQIIDAATSTYLFLNADRGLGILRAGQMDTPAPSVITVNADTIGNDGFIDLIDIAGDFGVAGAGGPQITTGPGGNVRYIRVGGDVYQDTFFGGGFPTRTVHDRGAAVTFRDDAGAQVTVSPTGQIANPTFDPMDPVTTGPEFLDAQLATTTYGIRGSGGVAVVKIETEQGVALSSNGLGNNMPLEIGEILVSGDNTMGYELMPNGTIQLVDPNAMPMTPAPTPGTDEDTGPVVSGFTFPPPPPNPALTQPPPPNPALNPPAAQLGMSLVITGTAPVDVWNVVGATAIPTSSNGVIIGALDYNQVNNVTLGGFFDKIVNTTGGEMVNAAIGGAQTIFTAGTLGLASSNSGATPEHGMGSFPATTFTQMLPFPFNQARNAFITGNTGSIVAQGAVGNLVIADPMMVMAGDFTTNPQFLQTLYVNSDARTPAGQFDGIAGPVFGTGNINFVNVGQGIMPSGTGNAGDAGLYVSGSIGGIAGTQTFVPGAQSGGRLAPSDIRGDIVASGMVGSISLTNGSIINADFITATDLADSREFIDFVMSTESPDTFDSPISEIGNITLSGTGGIIGLLVQSRDIGNVLVNRGFGIFNSAIVFTGDNVEGRAVTDGFGVRDVTFSGGAKLTELTARGRGERLDPLDYSASVRQSESSAFDPFFGTVPNRLTDMDVFLAFTPEPAGLHSGVIDNVVAQASRDLGTLTAYRITSTGVAGVGPFEDPFNPQSQISFANSIGTIRTTGIVDPLTGMGPVIDLVQITTGSIRSFLPGSDVSRLDMVVSGQINRVFIRGSLSGDSKIEADGPNGDIRYVSVTGDINGTLRASGKVGTVIIGGDMDGNLLIEATNTKALALGLLRLGGRLGSGSFRVMGDVGTVMVAGSLGQSGEQMLVRGNMRMLYVGFDTNAATVPVISLDVLVFGNLSSLILNGRIEGNIEIGGDLNLLSLRKHRKDTQAVDARLIGQEAQVNIQGQTRTIIVQGGDLGAQSALAVGEGIGTFILYGSMEQGSTVSTSFGDITTFIVRGGDIHGSVNVYNGSIRTFINQGGSLSASPGQIHIDPQHVIDGVTATLSDGVNTVTFEFGSAGSVQPGNTPVTRGANAPQTTTNLKNAINASILTLTAAISADDPRVILITNDNLAQMGNIPILVTGDNITALPGTPVTITADELAVLNVTGSVGAGTMIDVSRQIRTLLIGQDVSAGAEVHAGSASYVSVGRDMLGALEVGAGGTRPTFVSIRRDLGGNTEVRGSALMTVGRDLLSDGIVSIGRNLDLLNVRGTGGGAVLVDGSGGNFIFNALNEAVVTTGQGLRYLRTTGRIDNSLIQTGIRRGEDGVFASTTGAKDFGEDSAPAELGSVYASVIGNSIVNSSGDFMTLTARQLVDTSVSSGFSAGSLAVAAVLAEKLAGTTPLNTAAQRNAARSAADRELAHGQIRSVSLSAAGTNATRSALTAGVDPGDDGIFGNVDANPANNDHVVFMMPGRSLPDGGGQSEIGSALVRMDGSSFVLADTGIRSDRTSGGTVRDQLTYDVADLLAPALAGMAPTAVLDNTTFTFDLPNGANPITVSRTGAGTVQVFDRVAGDNFIDAIVVTDGSSANVKVDTAGAVVTVGQLLTADDVEIGGFDIKGGVAADGSGAVNLFLDGQVSKQLKLTRDIGDGVTGVIGGDVGTFSFRSQDSAVLRIGGKVNNYTVQQGTSTGLTVDQATLATLNALLDVPMLNPTALATDSTGVRWLFDEGTRRIAQINPGPDGILGTGDDPANPVMGTFTVNTAGLGDRVALDALDFTGGDVLLGVATVNNQSPTRLVGPVTDTTVSPPLSLHGLTVDGAGRVLGVSTVLNPSTGNLEDQLVQFDPATGAAFPIGTLVDIFANRFNGNFLGLASDDAGNLYGLVNDRDGSGAANLPVDGVALVLIEADDVNGDGFLTVTNPVNTNLPALLLNDGGVPVVPPATFTAFAIRNNAVPPSTAAAVLREGGSDVLVTIALVDDPIAGVTAGDMTRIGTIKVDLDGDGTGDVAADTSIIGFGFDEEQNLVAYNNRGTAGLIVIAKDTVDPTQFLVDGGGNVVARQVTTANALSTAIDAYAVGRSGAYFPTYAYDTDVAGGQFFTNPSNLAFNNDARDPRPNIPINGDLGDFDVRALTIRNTGGTFALVNNGTSFDLHEVLLDPRGGGVTGFPMRGNVVNVDSGNPVQNILTVEAAPGTGTLLAVGTDGNTTQRELFGINFVDGSASSRGRIIVNGQVVRNPITGLAIDPATGIIYAARQVSGRTFLLQLTSLLGAQIVSGTTIGEIRVGGEATTIAGMDFSNGQLVATEVSTGGRRMIEVNLTSPTDSFQLTAPNTVNRNVTDLATDAAGRIYGVFADGMTHQLMINPLGNFVPTLGIVNTDPTSALAGQFLQMQGLSQDATGVGLDTAVTAIAANNAGPGGFGDVNNVYAATSDSQLFRYSPNDASFVRQVGQIAEVLSDGSHRPIRVSGMDFDVPGQALIAKDGQFNRLVVIDRDLTMSAGFARTSSLTQSGALPSQIGELSYDPVQGAFFSVFNDPINDANDRFVRLLGTRQENLTGVELESISTLRITGGADFSSRIASTGNSFTNVTIDGNFDGSLVTPGSISNFTMNNGTFAGLVQANDNIRSAVFNGVSFTAGGVLRTDADLGTFRQSGGAFGGVVVAHTAGRIEVSSGLPTASINVLSEAGTVKTNGQYAGQIQTGPITSTLEIGGVLGGSAFISVNGPAGTVTLDGGTVTGSKAMIDGPVGTLTIGGTHSGVVAIDNGAGTVRLNNATGGLLSIGLDTKSLTVRGVATDSVFTFGTLLGADGLYNTVDDVITGGSVFAATFDKDFIDSAILAGVLPALHNGPGLPADNRAYVGNALATDVRDQDSAEAGGILPSQIGKLTIKGRIISTSAATGRVSVAAAADAIDITNIGPFPGQLRQRVYVDPFGPPRVKELQIVDNSEFRVIFTEEVNSASLILSEDRNDNGVVTDLPDVLGTVLLTDQSGNVIDDVVLTYTTQVNTNGQIEGVLRLTRAAGFGTNNLIVTLSGGGAGALLDQPGIYDRSGGRSARRDFNQDGTPDALERPFGNANGPAVDPTMTEDYAGTLLDGDIDGLEGGDSVALVLFGDAPDDFVTALPNVIPLAPDAGPFVLNGDFSSFFDTDVFHISAAAGQYLSIKFTAITGFGVHDVGLFVQDDQGTPADITDDTFELVARHENLFDDTDPTDAIDVFEAFELPDTGEYFIALVPGSTARYRLELELFTGSAPIEATLPTGEKIAFVNNADNVPKQLVYLNFDGGTATKYTDNLGQPVDVVMDPFDAGVLDSRLSGLEDLLIEGGGNVTGIVDHVMSIYENTSPVDPRGQIHVQRLDEDLSPFLDPNAEGLFFTTVDPTLSGLNPETDFTTVFIGEEVTNVFSGFGGLFGIASEVDVANMEKADNALIFADSFAFLTASPNIVTLASQYARAIGNVVAHEFGHTLGLNHTDRYLIADDPDNNIVTMNDPVIDYGNPLIPNDDRVIPIISMISGGPNLNFPFDLINEVWQLGTAPLDSFEFALFPIGTNQPGSVDQVTSLLEWVS